MIRKPWSLEQIRIAVLVPGEIKWLENVYSESWKAKEVLVPGEIKWLENFLVIFEDVNKF